MLAGPGTRLSGSRGKHSTDDVGTYIYMIDRLGK